MLKRILPVVGVFLLICGLAGAQAAHRSDDVNGMAGTVRILPNAAGSCTTVVFTSNMPVSNTSNQIVFWLQGDKMPVPAAAWSGAARVFTGDGFIGIAAKDNPGVKYLFLFTDRDVPPLLVPFQFKTFNIVGIARYGEHKPLTEKQIASLAAVGHV